MEKRAGQESIAVMPISVALETEFFHLNLPHLLPSLGSLQGEKKKREKEKNLIPDVYTHRKNTSMEGRQNSFTLASLLQIAFGYFSTFISPERARYF